MVIRGGQQEAGRQRKNGHFMMDHDIIHYGFPASRSNCGNQIVAAAIQREMICDGKDKPRGHASLAGNPRPWGGEVAIAESDFGDCRGRIAACLLKVSVAT